MVTVHSVLKKVQTAPATQPGISWPPSNVQVRIGGDMALLRGVAKAVFETAEKNADVLDLEFIENYTEGCSEYRAIVESTPWSDLVQGSGVAEAAIRKLADSYMASKRVIVAWCLGLTQHEHGVDTVSRHRCQARSCGGACGR